MSWVVRPAREGDLDALFGMASRTGGGFTNLPPDRGALAAKLERSAAAFSRVEDFPDDELYVLILENLETGAVCGTAQIFSRIGVKWPFYSYKLTTLSQFSKELGRSFRADTLNLVTDFDGASEVGGLFLDPDARAGGLGRLLARSRYMFIAMHRARFADRVISELRGRVEPDGSAPFWDGLVGKFFGMPFSEADRFNSLHGNQFIADLMPKHPIYVALLPETAQAVIGEPHPSGRAAMRMLEAEGFRYDGYVDIFDGGPTMAAATDQIATVRQARPLSLAEIGNLADAQSWLAAAGHLSDFRAAMISGAVHEGGFCMDETSARALRVGIGDEFWHVAS